MPIFDFNINIKINITNIAPALKKDIKGDFSFAFLRIWSQFKLLRAF